MNKKYLKELIEEADKLDPQNDVLWEINRDKRFKEMSKDINETIKYLNECSEDELVWATEVLEELSKHFKSKELVDCVLNNASRCVDEENKRQVLQEVEYMKVHL